MSFERLCRWEPADPRPPAPAADAPDPFLRLLNRDQRTAITIDRMSRSESAGVRGAAFPRAERGHAATRPPPSDTSNSTERQIDGFTNRTRARGRGPRRRLSRLLSRLGEVFIVGVCLLTVVRVPGVMSAPSTRHAKASEQIHSQKPTENTLSYLHPCGKSHEEEMNKTYYKMAARETDPNILRHIMIKTENALAYAESFRDRYVEHTFHIRFEKHHAQWASQGYDWLPNERNGIPKRLGKDVPAAHLNNSTFNEFLKNIYEYLQKFAVGLEQIVADQKRTQGEFRENFRTMEDYLRGVLCEIREAMMERNVVPKEPVSRSIMSEDIRHLEQASFRNVRDWFIFRDLMNGLEYAIQVLEFFEKRLGASS